MNTINTHMADLHNNRNYILSSLLNKKESVLPRNTGKAKDIYWNEKSYDLDKSSFFKLLSEQERNEILVRLSRSRLEEAYHIEKAGIAFGAKMTLASSTFEERKLYAHFTAEESEHLAMVESYLSDVTGTTLSNSFLDYLSDIIQKSPKSVLTFIIQVVLEGWGLEHYGNLAKTCNDESLRKSLNKIVQDEAGHHGSGVLLFEEDKLSADELEMATVALENFLQMVKIGPFSIYQNVYQTNSQVKESSLEFLMEIDAVSQTQARLDLLKKLALKSGASQIVAACDKKGMFTSLPLLEMNEIYNSLV